MIDSKWMDSKGMEGKLPKIFGSNSKGWNSKVSNYTFGIDSGQKYLV